MAGATARRLGRPFAAALAAGAVVLVVAGAVLALHRSFADPGPVTLHLSSADPDAVASHTYLIDCDHQTVVRPASFVLTCADANSSLEPARWTVWGGSTARGSGSYVENDCKPNCAAGTFRDYDVEFTADRLAEADGTGHYRRITVHFVKAEPSWVRHRTAEFDVDFFHLG